MLSPHRGSPPLSSTNSVENSTYDGGSPGSRTFTVDDALDKIGFGRFQIKMICVLGFFGVADALEVMLLSVLSPVLRCEWGLSEWDVATVSTDKEEGLGMFVSFYISSDIGFPTAFFMLQVVFAGMLVFKLNHTGLTRGGPEV